VQCPITHYPVQYQAAVQPHPSRTGPERKALIAFLKHCQQQFCSFIHQAAAATRQRTERSDLFGLRVKLPPVTTSLTNQWYRDKTTSLKARYSAFSMQVVMNTCFLLNPEKKLAQIRHFVFEKNAKPLTPTHSNSKK